MLTSLLISNEIAFEILGLYFQPPTTNKSSNAISLEISNDVTNTHAIGNIIYTEYIHLFQLSGMILLVAMIGAIVLTFRRREGVKKQSYFRQISREKSEGVQLVEVESKKGVKFDD